MSHELWYTSAERGLKPGSRGFCTVKATRGLPGPLVHKLESLSGYAHLAPPQRTGNPANPVAYHFVCVLQGGKKWYVLSRVCDAGLDYSGRTNKFAHHVVLDRSELPLAGPAWLMAQPGFFDEAWDGRVGIVDGRNSIPQADLQPQPCQQWQALAGDAGWAGILAECILQDHGPPVHIIAPPNLLLLDLIREAVSLLPPELRWSSTFSTFYTDQFPADVSLRWRVAIAGTRDAIRAAAIRHQMVIDLTKPLPVPAALETPAVSAARAGAFIRPPATTAPEPPQPTYAAPATAPEPQVYPTAAPLQAVPPPMSQPHPPLIQAEREFGSPPRTLRHLESANAKSLSWIILLLTLPLIFVVGAAVGILWQDTVFKTLGRQKQTAKANAGAPTETKSRQ